MKTIINSFSLFILSAISSIALAHGGHDSNVFHMHLIEIVAVIVTFILGYCVILRRRAKKAKN